MIGSVQKEKNGTVKRIKLKRQTKVICTVNEKWNNSDNLTKLFNLGVDAIEIYSEMKEDIIKEIITNVKAYCKENGRYIPIICNLSYYRVYVAKINSGDEESLEINQGQQIYFVNEENSRVDDIATATPRIMTEPAFDFKNFSKSDLIHMNYGEVSFKVDEIDTDKATCSALNSGLIQKNFSISVEAKEHFSNKLITTDTSKLNKEIEQAVLLGCDFIVISVISDPVNEINEIRNKIAELAGNTKVIVKIDHPRAIELFDDFVEFADAIYFSRSDLNIKEQLSKICFHQKSIVSKCGYAYVPIIIAGTFLDTMRTLPHPIRAEISDIYNTVLQAIDCLLLTSEIISGNFPYDVIETLNEICSSCEKRVDYSNLFLEILYKTKKPMKIIEAVASSTVKTSFNLQAPIIITITEKGMAARCVSMYRPYCPVLALTSNENVANAVALLRGIFAMIYEEIHNIDSVISIANNFLLKSKLVNSNTNIVLLSGMNEKKNGTVDQMRVINVNDFLLEDKNKIDA